MRVIAILPVLVLSTACSTPPSTDGGGVDATADAHSTDARSDASATDGPTSDTPVMPSCGSDAWVTYGHDARRSFATDACIQGPLTVGWRYDPAPAAGQTLRGVFHAIADPRGAYLQWRASRDPYLGTTAIDLVSTTGMRTWTFDTGTDSNLGNWASLWMGTVLVNDDGLYMLDAASGMRVRDTGVDWWGQTAPDPTRLYVVNAAHIDGPGLFVAAVDMMLHPTWQSNQYGMCRIDASDLNGAIAIDSGTVFYAPKYATGMGVHLPFESGVYAFDGAAGTMRWAQTTTPSSTVSAGDGHVYLIENANTLVARNQSDGRVAWMATVMGAGTQAPVLAAGRVIVAGSAGVMAFDAATGDAGVDCRDDQRERATDDDVVHRRVRGSGVRRWTDSHVDGCRAREQHTRRDGSRWSARSLAHRRDRSLARSDRWRDGIGSRSRPDRIRRVRHGFDGAHRIAVDVKRFTLSVEILQTSS